MELIKLQKPGQKNGFTLIELLIVIVIIGILAGVLIQVINPKAQQNRAKDASVQSTIEKISLATQAFISAYGRSPTESELMASLDHAAASNATICTGTTLTDNNSYSCTFSIEGSELGSTCSSDWAGTGTATCYYRYYSTTATTWAPAGRFRVYAKSYALTDRVFVYDNLLSKLYNCAATANIDTIADIKTSTSCTVNQLLVLILFVNDSFD